MISVLTLLAALLFISFHLPIPLISTGRPARLIGVGYHLLLLPAVAALPAPEWAKAAGFGWMIIDIVLNGAAFVGLKEEIGDALRQGVHILSALWVVAAGWTGGWYLAAAGTLLGAAFITRFIMSGMGFAQKKWLPNTNAALNVLWMITVAVALWGTNL
jgi:hypothetical protein